MGKAFLVLLCSILLFGCQKDGSNPAATTTLVDINISIESINFGTLSVSGGAYSSSSKNTTLTNPSSSNADLTGSVTVLGDYFSLSSGGPSYRLSPGKSLTITVTYRPLAVGTHTGSVSIQHNVPTKSSPMTVLLFGKAVQ